MKADLLAAARAQSATSFASTYAHPFLLWVADDAASAASRSFKTSQLDMKAVFQRTAKRMDPDRVELLPVKKRGDSPWRDRVSIGRARNNDIVVADDSVSKLHAHLIRDGEQWTIRDNNSANGTEVNGMPAATGGEFLGDGDILRLGRVELEFLDAGTAWTRIRELLGPASGH